MDKIFIDRLHVRGIIGINEDERDKPQDIVISIGLFIDLKPAGKSDDITKSVNYRTIVKRVMAFAESAERFTVEALAEDIASLCLEYPDVTQVQVRIEKPAAARFAEAVGVEIYRQRL
jgi:FolB domain-containing protein